MADVDLPALVDAGALVAQEHRAHLDGAIGIADAMVDPAQGLLAFTDLEGRRRSITAHFVGTASPADGTWLWSWRNINDFPRPFIREAERVRSLGERYGIAELTAPSFAAAGSRPAAIAGAVGALTGVTATWSVPIGNGGTVAWLLLDDPGLALPPPTVARAVGVVTAALADGTAVDHRRALVAWADQRGATLTPEDDRSLRLRLPDGELRIRLDDDDRITGLGRRPAQPARSAQSAQPTGGAASVRAVTLPAAAPAVEPAPAAHSDAARSDRSAEEDGEQDLRLEHLFGPAPETGSIPQAPRTWRDRVRDLFV